MKKLQPLEVLHHWAQDADPRWVGGYVYVRTEPSGCVIAQHVGGHLDGCESRWTAEQVRPAAGPTPLIKTGLDAYLRAEVESVATLEDLEARIAWLDERHTGALTQEQRQNVATDLANLRRIRLNHFQRSPVDEPVPESRDEAAAQADHDHDQAKDDRLTGDR